VVVDVAAATTAAALAAAGAVVVVVGPPEEAGAVGQVVADLVARGSRAVAFVGDPALPQVADALAELVGELFPTLAPAAPEPA